MNADEIKVREIQVKSILSTSNLPVANYSVNPYVGCPHACKYCYASFMKRFTGIRNHGEPFWTSNTGRKYATPGNTRENSCLSVP